VRAPVYWDRALAWAPDHPSPGRTTAVCSSYWAGTAD